MSQIAQQDHLYINVGDLGLDEPAAIALDFWKELEEKAKAKTLCDVILIDSEGNFAKISSATFRDNGDFLAVSYVYNTTVYTIEKQ